MHSFAWWPTLLVLAVAVFTDMRSRRIPNWLVIPFLVAGIAVSGWLHGGHGILQSVEGLGLALLIYGFLFLMGGMGAGDVKLCAAIGAWIGPGQLIVALIIISVAGGVMALGWAAYRGFLKELFSGAGTLAFGWFKHGAHHNPELDINHPQARKMPYAPAIAIGTLLSFFAR